MAYKTNPSASDLKYEDLTRIEEIASDIQEIAHDLVEDFYHDHYAEYTADDFMNAFAEIRENVYEGMAFIERAVANQNRKRPTSRTLDDARKKYGW